MTNSLHFVFAKNQYNQDAPDMVFVEAENDYGQGVGIGTWHDRGDGTYHLVITEKQAADFFHVKGDYLIGQQRLDNSVHQTPGAVLSFRRQWEKNKTEENALNWINAENTLTDDEFKEYMDAWRAGNVDVGTVNAEVRSAMFGTPVAEGTSSLPSQVGGRSMAEVIDGADKNVGGVEVVTDGQKVEGYVQLRIPSTAESIQQAVSPNERDILKRMGEQRYGR